MFCIHKIISSSLVISSLVYKIMQYFLNPRLQIYSKLICKYDTLDKEFLFSTNLMFKPSFIKVSCCINSLKVQNFSIILNKEFVTLQRIAYWTKSKKSNSDSVKIFVNLRRSILYLYLELFLHTHFLDKNVRFNFDKDYCKYLFFIDKFSYFFVAKFLVNLDSCVFCNENILLYLFF
uniref:Uncharacterized protein n=1 Tax=Lithothamnion sp. TaxID=1940749 RepID=A0A3G3MIH5_9FLOR|nr:hypothetical protein [Lithothamnion sp.]